MRTLILAICLSLFAAADLFSQETADMPRGLVAYRHKETIDLVGLVKDAAALIKKEGEAAFPEFKKEGSKWRHGDIYVFVIDTKGNMVLHPDPALEGKNQLGLKDANNRPIGKGFSDVVSGDKEGWYHYQWPEPGSIFPLWKSSFLQQVSAPSGKKYIVGCGLYNMQMELGFITDLVDSAAALVEKEGRKAFPKLRDKTGPYMFRDIYVFVDNPEGVELVNGAFPSIEGRNLIDYKDSKGYPMVHEYIDVAMNKGSGWVTYLWPEPGKASPSHKLTYVKKAEYKGEVFIVGSGTYLPD